jgi:hypothetical protein
VKYAIVEFGTPVVGQIHKQRMRVPDDWYASDRNQCALINEASRKALARGVKVGCALSIRVPRMGAARSLVFDYMSATTHRFR